MKFKNDTVYTTKGKKWTRKKTRSEYRHQVLGRRGIQKKRLMANPKKILGAEGVNVPDGVSILVVEDTEQVRTLIIPPAPPFHLDDDQLKGITGGCVGTLPNFMMTI